MIPVVCKLTFITQTQKPSNKSATTSCKNNPQKSSCCLKNNSVSKQLFLQLVARKMHKTTHRLSQKCKRPSHEEGTQIETHMRHSDHRVFLPALSPDVNSNTALLLQVQLQQQQQIEIWGRAQDEATWHCKSDWWSVVYLFIKLLIKHMVPNTLQNSFSPTSQDKMNCFPWLICSREISMSVFNCL